MEQQLGTLFSNPFIYDVESYSNLFTVVFKSLEDKPVYHKFIIHSSQNDVESLLEFLQINPVLIGFNNLAYDSQVIEYIYLNPNVTAEEIYIFSQKLFEEKENRFEVPYSEWDLSFKQIDLFKLNHYDNTSRKTSLKWLEFTLRWVKMADMPLHHSENVSKSNISKILSYNKNDVDVTYDFFYKCDQQIRLRLELARKYHSWRMMSMSDSSMGAFIFKSILSKKVDKERLKKKSFRDFIDLKDCLLPHLRFSSEEFNTILDHYKTAVINVKKDGLKGVINVETNFDGALFKFGTGGIHAAYKAGVYESDDEYVILSIDGKSYYPWVIIANDFFPAHIGKTYCEAYMEVYEMRTAFPKGSAMNHALKIVLNGVYGKSNSVYSYLYDPKLTLQITVNGQLMLAMLAERLSRVGRLLLVNTDGLEIRVKRSDLDQVKDICEQWEALTGITLEENVYKKVVIRDVNSYIAVDLDNNVKRKGFFSLYEDLTGQDGTEHEYHKNPSANIIPTAVFEYFINGKNVEETIFNHNNIHDFLYAIKSQKGFDFWFITANDDGIIDIEKRRDRVLRYFISRKGANIFKHWNDNRKADITGVNRGQLVTLAMTIKDEEIEGEIKSGKYAGEPLINYSNLNKDHYVSECYRTIDEIRASSI